MCYEDNETSWTVFLECVGGLLLVLLLLASLLLCVKGREFAYNDISCVTCTCGAQYLTPYEKCAKCGASSDCGTYVVSFYCTNCNETFLGSNTCPKCGSYVDSRFTKGIVATLPTYIRMWY